MTKEEALRIHNLPEAEKEVEIARLTEERFQHRPKHLPPPALNIVGMARLAVRLAIEAHVGQPWVDDYQKHPTEEPPPDVIAWLKSRPQVIRELMLRFPPGCLVRTKPGVDLFEPQPGTIGLLRGYHENGELSVQQGPDSPTCVTIPADDLEVAVDAPDTPASKLREIWSMD